LLDRRIVELSGGVPGLEHHERPEYADRIAVLRNNGQALAQSTSALSMTLGTIASLVATITLLVTLDARLLLMPLFAVVSMAAVATAQTVKQRGAMLAAQPGRLATHLFTLSTQGSPAKELRIFGLRREMAARHDAARLAIRGILMRAGVKSAAIEVAGWLAFSAGYSAALLLMAWRAVHGKATPGQMVMALNLTSQVNQNVSMTVGMLSWLVATMHIVHRYRWLLRFADRVKARMTSDAPVPDVIRDGIEFRGVTFQYPGTDKDVLTDVNLRIPAGATLAIVGENGAGKTTLVKLLARFYEPNEGSISVDGVGLARMDVDAWRLRLSAAFQDFAHLEFTAAEAVGVGDVSRLGDEVAVRRALERASASDVVESLPEGLGTQLGRTFSGGVELSGGQWQKLALGRAMMRERPLLLLLDEPTASLDAETEHALFERYAGAAREAASASGAITVLVSHRFSTVRMADVIVVIAGGRITEQGSHDELMALNGTYAELYSMQARAYR
jgi:ATP-binding cassette subfamily B protein